MGTLKILNPEGQEELTWNVESPREVRAAREKFDYYLKQPGVIACRIETGSAEAVPVSRFDPAAAEIFVLQLVGGG